MSSDLSDLSNERLEANCKTTMANFINKLMEHYVTLCKHSDTMFQYATDLEIRCDHAVNLRDAKLSSAFTDLTQKQKDDLQEQIYVKANFYVQHSLQLITDIREAYNEVKQLYESFMAAANALKIKAKEGVLITGSSKQRPLSYYVEGGLDSLKIWNDFCQRLTKTHGSMEFPDHSTIAGFRQTTSTRQEIRQKFWNFLIYCSYVDGVNIQKGK